MPEFPKIETLYERDDKFKVKPGFLKNRAYSLIKTWLWNEKIDGTNMRCIWDHLKQEVTFNGRTDNANVPGDLITTMSKMFPAEKLLAIFPDASVTLYGEGYGAGIQKGGDLSPTKKFILFDVLVNDKWWLNTENVQDVGSKLGVEVVPFIGEYTLDQAAIIVKAGFQSALNGGKAKAEGMVGRPHETLFDANGDRLIVKLKTKDF